MRITERSARVVTFKLAAALEKYEANIRALAAATFDIERLRQIQRDVVQLRMLCASLPRLSVPSLAVLLSHSRLVQALATRVRPAIQALLNDHLTAIDDLHRRCLRMMGARDAPLT